MDKNKINALRFYQIEGLDEVLFDKPVDFFARKDLEEKKPQIVQNKTNIQLVNSKVTTVNKFEVKKEEVAAVTVKSSGGVLAAKPASTYDAISSLAKRNIFNNPNKKFMSIDEIVNKAKKQAKEAKNLAELRKAVENFDGCSLQKMATNTVFCDGNPDSKVMVIGEAPGNHEDLQGIPFCGDSGKLLDAMFGSINMKREKDYYISNVIFWRPPGNRRPTDEELAICRPFVERHIQLVDPKIIILVGATSMSAVLGMKDPVTKVRGKIIDYAPDFMDRKVDSFVLFHPSYLMRQSGKKRVAWRDMLALESHLNS